MFLEKCANLFLKNRKHLCFNFRLSQKVFHCAKFRTSSPLWFKTKYGGRFTVTMIAGDGDGPQLMKHVKDVFKVAGVPVDFEEVQLHSTDCDSKIHAAIASIRRNGVAIKGNINTKRNDFEFQSRNVILRKQLDLFANVLHCKNQPSIKTRHENIDLILIRQNTEGEYSCLEHEIAPGVIESLKIVTEARSEEIAQFAFEYAIQNHRRKIVTVHKASVMPLTDGLFLKTCMLVAQRYTGIELEIMLMDTCCSMMVTKPQQFDVLLLPNLYGNVLNNIACGLIGGGGIVSGKNYGHDCVVFEVGSRSSEPSGNPIAMLNASVDLLNYLGLQTYAATIEDAVYKTLNVDKILTEDFGGFADASDVIHRVMEIIRSKVPGVKL